MMTDTNKMMDNELENVAGGAGSGAQYYQVVSGDTLSGIALKFRTDVNTLLRLNPRITNANLIYVGELIRIR